MVSICKEGWGGGGWGWEWGGWGLLCRFMNGAMSCCIYIILTLRERYMTSCAIMKIQTRRRNNYIEESVGM